MSRSAVVQVGFILFIGVTLLASAQGQVDTSDTNGQKVDQNAAKDLRVKDMPDKNKQRVDQNAVKNSRAKDTPTSIEKMTLVVQIVGFMAVVAGIVIGAVNVAFQVRAATT